MHTFIYFSEGKYFSRLFYIIFCYIGVLIDFISIPVTVGFTSATSVIIAVSQLKGLLGLKFESDGSFLDTVKNVGKQLHKTTIPDLCLGVTCIFILLILRVNKFFFLF